MAGRNTPFYLIFSSLLLMTIRLSDGHVSLTFPPARYPALDFLDNARTKGPCGVPKPSTGKGNPTTLRSGSTFNVTWTLTYPHQGGFRIELLDDKDQPRYALTPEHVQFIGQDDQTSQRYQVTLPSDFECQNCGVRLIRLAAEWGDYQFWSCADINIVREPKDPCRGHGEWKEGQCECERLYSGESCQSKDECWSDQDCGTNGKCEELKTVTYPRRVCYCAQGWFGPSCNWVSPIQKSTLDFSQFQSQVFGPDNNKLFWRILKDKDEVEIVLQYPSQSWIGLGWRPENIAASCSNIERLAGFGPVTGESVSTPPSPSAEPRPEPKPASPDVLATLPNLPPPPPTNETLPPAPDFPHVGNFTEPSSKNGSSIIGNITSEILNAPFTGTTLDYSAQTLSSWTSQGQGPVNQSVSVPRAGSDVLSNVSTGEAPFQGPFVSPVPGLVTAVDFTGTPVPFPPPYASSNASQPIRRVEINESDVVGELCYGDWRYPAECNDSCDERLSWTYVEETDEIEFSIEAKSPTNTWIAVGFSATGTMNDADMVVVKSLQNKISIVDMFSTGYAPPAKDPQQNVSVGPVTGTHANGVLRASFRRPRRSSDPNDVSFTDTDCFHFLLTRGQLNSDGSMNKHAAKPHVSKKKVCIASCNPSPLGGAGEKYVTCEREFKFPSGCRPPACDYMANWTYVSQTQEVFFEISAKEIGRWTGIGFSRDGNMTNSDIIIGWVYENGTYVTDRFAYGRQQPAIDKQQDIRDVHGRIEDDVQTITFSRKMVTNDREDISLKECLYYLFPVGGGRVLARTSNDFQDKTTPLGFHDQTLPKISRDLICICNDEGIPVNITSARLRRQATLDEQVQPQTHSQSSPVNITLGAQPIPVLDPKTVEESLLATALSPVEPRASSVPSPTTNTNNTEKLAHQQWASPASNYSTAESPLYPSSPVFPKLTQSPLPEPEPTSNGTSGNGTGPANAPTSEPRPTGAASPEPKAEPKPEPKAEPKPEPKAEPKPEPQPEPKAEPKPHGEPASAGSELHPMDCTDMVIGSVVGDYSRVADYYSISRSIPKLDDYFGGSQSLTGATGYEENGMTTIAFRRRLSSFDPFDHNITLDSPMFLIWAKGQETGHYSHNAPSGLDQGTASVKEFYTPRVLAYHGNQNRGHFTLNFGGKGSTQGGSSNEPCLQQFLYPSGCKSETCKYNVTWVKEGDDVQFWLEAEMDNNHWTGIGFSKDGAMAKSDMVIVTTETAGPPEVTDRFASGYNAPTEDKKQNIYNIDASYVNGRLNARFSRTLKTDDPEEDVDLTECVYFLYPYSAGPIADHQPLKHSSTPLKSSQLVCLTKCRSNAEWTASTEMEHTKTTPASKKTPDVAAAAPVVDRGHKFSVIVRLVNEHWSESLAVPSSSEHQALSGKVIKVVDNILRTKYAGFEQVRVLRFSQGSVIAEMEVSAAGLNSMQLQETLISQASAGAIEGLQLDPEYVRVKEIQIGLTPEEIRNYVIIGVACFLVMVATAFAVCMIVRTRRQRSRDITGMYPPPYQYPAMAPAPIYSYDQKGPLTTGAPAYSVAYAMTGARQFGGHHRQYSNATTATPGGNGKTPSPVSEKPGGAGQTGRATAMSNKNGNGETTYAEWVNRVNTAGQTQQTGRRQQSVAGGPYVQYPNDPYSFYTLNGSQRNTSFMQAMPPHSGYYRPGGF